MKKYISFILAILCPVLYAYQQPPTRLAALTVGDRVPNLPFKTMINYILPKAALSDFHHKMVVLDFWGTTCGSCRKDVPMLDSLQKQFCDQLQIVLVNVLPHTVDTRDQVNRYLQKMQAAIPGFFLPIAIEDRLGLLHLFPHTYIPHYVWIGPTGIVLAITGSEEMTVLNVTATLAGHLPDLPIKRDSI